VSTNGDWVAEDPHHGRAHDARDQDSIDRETAASERAAEAGEAPPPRDDP
jgi:hypothetical protein